MQRCRSESGTGLVGPTVIVSEPNRLYLAPNPIRETRCVTRQRVERCLLLMVMKVVGWSVFVAALLVVPAGCTGAGVGSASKPSTTTPTYQQAQSKPTPNIYSGTVQFDTADAGRTVDVVVGTEIDVLYPTATGVATETQPASAIITWIGFRPGLVTRFRAVAVGRARIIPTDSCVGMPMHCLPFELIVNVRSQ